MKSVVRWAVASFITVVTFGAVTAVCGALVLPLLLTDGSVRWGIAASLGTAVAALAAIWGQSFATSMPAEPGEGKPGGEEPANARNVINGGTFHQPVIQGRDAVIQLSESTSPSPGLELDD